MRLLVLIRTFLIDQHAGRQHVLARAALPLMLAEPGTRAAVALGPQPHVMRHVRPATPTSKRSLAQVRRARRPRRRRAACGHPSAAAATIRPAPGRTAARDGNSGRWPRRIPPGRASRAPPAPRRPPPPAGPASPPAPALSICDCQARLRLHVGQRLLPLPAGQLLQHLPFAGESAVELRAEHQQETPGGKDRPPSR